MTNKPREQLIEEMWKQYYSDYCATKTCQVCFQAGAKAAFEISDKDIAERDDDKMAADAWRQYKLTAEISDKAFEQGKTEAEKGVNIAISKAYNDGWNEADEGRKQAEAWWATRITEFCKLERDARFRGLISQDDKLRGAALLDEMDARAKQVLEGK